MGAPFAYGGEQAHSASLSVKAKTESKQDKTEASDAKQDVSVATTVKTETETCTLEIEIGNQTEQKDSYQLEWFFISKKTSGAVSEKPSVFSSGKAELTLAGGASITRKEVSKPFVYTTKTVDRTGPGGRFGNSQQTRGGDVYAGYLVLVKAGGEILQKESNDAWFLTDEWLAQCESTIKAPAPAPVKKKKQ